MIDGFYATFFFWGRPTPPFCCQVTVRCRHVTPLEADTGDDADFKEARGGLDSNGSRCFLVKNAGVFWSSSGNNLENLVKSSLVLRNHMQKMSR